MLKNKEVAEPILLSLRDAASRLSIAVPTLRRWLRERRLAHVRCGRAVRVESVEVQRFIATNRHPARDEKNAIDEGMASADALPKKTNRSLIGNTDEPPQCQAAKRT